jgi:prepilin-type N-terminal cleavage/methylation domain-containing protein
MSRRHSHRPRTAFTLVELLVVIAILGVLATLTSSVVFKAMRKAKGNAITSEMTMLESAFKEYKSQYGQYPPNMGDAMPNSPGGTAEPLRQWRFDQHLKRFCPRMTIVYNNLYTYLQNNTSNYYNYQVAVNTGSGSPSVQRLDISTMDPAEALVFWLGGFPAPCNSSGQPLCSTKLIGFHSNPTNPFMLDIYNATNPMAFIQSRKAKLFDFDETRLVDNDMDGWLEYAPPGVSPTSGATPPYVYFDAGGYTYPWPSSSMAPFGAYPAAIMGTKNSQNTTMMQTLSGSTSSGSSGGGSSSGGSSSTSGSGGSGWGLAVPYASTFSQGTLMPAQWINPVSIQIVCCGLDGLYGSQSNAMLRIPTYPSGVTYSGSGYSTATFYDPEELDNLTNFSPGRLDDQVPN